MRWRRGPSAESLMAEREALVAQLEACEEQAAWELAGDTQAEVADGEVWARQARALREAVAAIDERLARLRDPE